jgi:hypothetical protein
MSRRGGVRRSRSEGTQGSQAFRSQNSFPQNALGKRAFAIAAEDDLIQMRQTEGQREVSAPIEPWNPPHVMEMFFLRLPSMTL